MFKHIKLSEQLRQAQAEVNRLKSMVGEFPIQENHEGSVEEIENKTLVKEIEKRQADIDYIAIMTGVGL